jgi:hypothetical protein
VIRASRHGVAAVFSAVLQLALSFCLTADLVLCSSAAGHVAVESAFSAECCNPHVLPEGLRAGDDCGCVDTPLFQSPVEVRSRLEHALASLQLVLLPAFARPVLACSPLTCSASPAHRSGPSEDALTARRSVVLLV